jgi:tetratricopeptide (TPR) repeat protein
VIVTGLFSLWDQAGRRQEHRDLVERALTLIDESRHPLVVSYLLRSLMMRALYEQSALDAVERAVRLGEHAGDAVALAKLYVVVTQVQATHGLFAEAERSAELASRLLASEHKQDSMFHVALLLNRSHLRMRQGRFAEARADLEAAEAQALALGSRDYVVCLCYLRRSEVEHLAGDKHLAIDFLRRIVDGELSDLRVATQARLGIANLRLQLGDVDGALDPLREILLQVRGNESETMSELEYAALALALRGRSIAAARLLGWIRAFELPHFRRPTVRQEAYELLCSSLRRKLNEEAIAGAGADGARLTLDEAVDEALAGLESIER